MILKRGDFYRHYNNGQLRLVNNTITAYSKPTGALCEVRRTGDTTSLMNGEYRFVNSELSEYLSGLGIEGEVLIHHLTNSRNVPKWLTYHHHHSDFVDWSKEIKIFLFGQTPKKVGHIPIETLHPLEINVDDLRQVIDKLSTDNNFDGLLIEAETIEGMQRYHMVPTRYCDGVISSVTDDGERTKLVVDIEHNGMTYTTAVTSMTTTLQGMVEQDHDSIIGRRMKIQYTTFVPGDRLKNFSSPVGLFILDR
jgi:hypothetical protein